MKKDRPTNATRPQDRPATASKAYEQPKVVRAGTLTSITGFSF